MLSASKRQQTYRSVNCGAAAHNWPRTKVIHADRNARGIFCRTENVLLICPCEAIVSIERISRHDQLLFAWHFQPCRDRLRAMTFERTQTQFAAHAGVPRGLYSGTVANLPPCDTIANGNYHPGTLVSGRLHAIISHSRKWQIFQHIMDVTVTYASDSQFEQELTRAYDKRQFPILSSRAAMRCTRLRDRHFFNLQDKIFAVSLHHSSFTMGRYIGTGCNHCPGDNEK